MNTKIINYNVKEILNQGMGDEIHWFPDNFSIGNLAETLVGLANTKGGVVLIGIAPRANRVVGVKNLSETFDRIFQAALLADPPLVLSMPQVAVEDSRKIIRVNIPSGLPHVYNLEGKYFGRNGKLNITLSPVELRALLMERGIIQFESRLPPSATLSDLDYEKVKDYLRILQIPRDEPLEDFLINRACLKLENGEKRPTYAALLLFGKRPQRWLPNSILLASRFPGEQYCDEFVKQEIHGTLPNQIRQAEVFIRTHMKTVVRLVGITRQETEEYPIEAIREILVNAIAHRDYNVGGDSIQIHMFSNRLEIHSPGRLPGPVNLTNLLEARFSRNAVIAQVLSDLGFVERIGYGLNRVIRVMEENNLPAPRFEEVGNSFRVTLWNGSNQNLDGVQGVDIDYSITKGMNLNKRQKSAVQHLFKTGRITNRDFQELCPEVSSETIRRDLVDLVRKGLLIKIGDKKSTYYILKNK